MDIQESIAQARQLLESLQQAATLDGAVKAAEAETRSKLQSLLRLAGANTVISDIDPSELVRFASRPHLVRPLGRGKRWEVYVPKLFRLDNVGWPTREEGEYAVYLVSPFVATIVPIASEIREVIPELETADFAAHVEGLDLVVDSGDPDEVAQKIGGGKVIVGRKGQRLRLKAQARFNVLCDLIRMGVLPWAPNPVPASLRRKPQVAFELRDYQAADYETFLEHSAIGLFAYGGTGKTFFGMYALAEIIGPKVVFAPNVILLEQWKARLEWYAPHVLSEVTFLTYASLHKARGAKWSLAIFDEVHRLVATTYLEAAYVDAAARIGMSATPVRTDGREDLIEALCGPAAGLRWPIKEIAKPIVTVWGVKTGADKLRKARQVAQAHQGRVLIYADHLAVGQQMADELCVPFVHGKTRSPLEVVQDHCVVVVSRVGDLGLSLDVDCIIQLDYAGRSMAQEGQRGMRAGHAADAKTHRTEMHILATPDEYRRFVRERTLIYQRWGIGVNVRVDGAVSENDMEKPSRPIPRRPARTRRAPRRENAPRPAEAGSQSSDEVEEAWNLPGIQVKVAETRKRLKAHAWPYVRLLFELCFQAPFSLEELFLLKGISNKATRSRYRTASQAMLYTGLLVDADEQRFETNHVLVEQIRALREASRRA